MVMSRFALDSRLVPDFQRPDFSVFWYSWLSLLPVFVSGQVRVLGM
jgi:hypothetical protein